MFVPALRAKYDTDRCLPRLFLEENTGENTEDGEEGTTNGGAGTTNGGEGTTNGGETSQLSHGHPLEKISFNLDGRRLAG